MSGYPNAIVLQNLEQALQDLLSESGCLTQGVRNVVQWARSNHGLDRELFLIFVGVDSDTDRFPLGSVREGWSESELREIDAERFAAEAHYRDMILDSGRSLLDAVVAIRPQATYTDPRGG